MEINVDFLLKSIKDLKDLMESIRNTPEQKVNVDKLSENFTDDQRKAFSEIHDLLMAVDRLVHNNYDSAVAQAVNAVIRNIASDSNVHVNYLVESDRKTRKLVLDSEMIEALKSAKNLKTNIEAIHTILVTNGIEIPESVYKRHDSDDAKKKVKKGDLVLNTQGQRVLDLPRIDNVKDDETVGQRGRPAKTYTLVLGTVNDWDEEYGYTEEHVDWHDNPFLGTTFHNLYGSVRADHNHVGLFKAVEKSGQSVTDGWDKPVEYAGRMWVAKVRK